MEVPLEANLSTGTRGNVDAPNLGLFHPVLFSALHTTQKCFDRASHPKSGSLALFARTKLTLFHPKVSKFERCPRFRLKFNLKTKQFSFKNSKVTALHLGQVVDLENM